MLEIQPGQPGQPGQPNPEEVVDTTGEKYIQTIKELKENSVSKEEYEKLLKERNQLIDVLKEGGTIENNDLSEDTNELRKKLFNTELSNLEYIETALKLRKNVLEETGEDIFVAKGNGVVNTTTDYQQAQRVADILEQLVEEAEGSSAIFTQKLQECMKDSVILAKKK